MFDLYASFIIGDEGSDYALTLGADIDGGAGNAMNFQNNQAFSTHDDDNDGTTNDCVDLYKGGWWYGNANNNCHEANLNGLYLKGAYTPQDYTGIDYMSWKGYHYSLAATEMKVRPAP
ncbi:ficolin-2-like [Amphiura filiformis]|uniref:ficolin-2-like n=1 Tax=Amphiura filiformis TaxID=82378 RepID=UPI003B218872